MSQDYLGIDLKIDPETRDLVLDGVGEPETVSGRECLQQDIRHSIISDPAILGFIQQDIRPADERELKGLVIIRAEADPRVIPGTAQAKVTQADKDGLVIELEYQPIGTDIKENLVVRLGGYQ